MNHKKCGYCSTVLFSGKTTRVTQISDLPMVRSELYVLVAAACGTGICYSLYSLSLSLKSTREALIKEQENRKSERNGRIRAEQELRKVQLEAAATAAVTGTQHGSGSKAETSSSIPSFPFKPIGYLRSCFSQRYDDIRYMIALPVYTQNH